RVGIRLGKPLAEEVVGDVDAIELERVLVERASEALGTPFGRGRSIAALHRAGRLGHEIVEAEPARWRVRYPVLVEGRADFVRRGVDDRRLGGDADTLGQRADLEADVLLERAADADAQSLERDRLEPGQLEADVVGARRQVADPIAAAVGGDRRLRARNVRPGDADGYARS